MSLEFIAELNSEITGKAKARLSEADIERLRETVMKEDLAISRTNGDYNVYKVKGDSYSIICKIALSAIPQAYKARVEELIDRPRNIRLQEIIGSMY